MSYNDQINAFRTNEHFRIDNFAVKELKSLRGNGVAGFVNRFRPSVRTKINDLAMRVNIAHKEVDDCWKERASTSRGISNFSSVFCKVVGGGCWGLPGLAGGQFVGELIGDGIARWENKGLFKSRVGKSFY